MCGGGEGDIEGDRIADETVVNSLMTVIDDAEISDCDGDGDDESSDSGVDDSYSSGVFGGSHFCLVVLVVFRGVGEAGIVVDKHILEMAVKVVIVKEIKMGMSCVSTVICTEPRNGS